MQTCVYTTAFIYLQWIGYDVMGMDEM
jgi:hypothetical protein